MTIKKHDIVEVSVIVLHETEKAWLVTATGDKKDKQWIPKSVGQLDGNTLSVPEWLAEEKDFL